MILVAQQSAFAESLPNPNELHQQFVSLAVGQSLTPNALGKLLSEAGYEAESEAPRAGLWDKRGEVVDVWPTESEAPFRISFDTNTIASIHQGHGKTMVKTNELSIAPIGMRQLDPRISLLAYLQPMRTLIVVPRQSLL